MVPGGPWYCQQQRRPSYRKFMQQLAANDAEELLGFVWDVHCAVSRLRGRFAVKLVVSFAVHCAADDEIEMFTTGCHCVAPRRRQPPLPRCAPLCLSFLETSGIKPKGKKLKQSGREKCLPFLVLLL